MKIGFDIRLLAYNNSGIGRYIKGILPELFKQNHSHEFINFVSLKFSECHLYENSKMLFTPPHSVYEGVFLPLELKKYKLDFFHAFDFYVPVKKGLRVVSSVYDLYFLRDTINLNRSYISHYLKSPAYLKNATHIICCSKSTQNDVCELLDIPLSNSSVVYPGIDVSIWNEKSEERIIPHDYMLFVGTIEPRKNLERTLIAYQLAKKSLNERLPPLVIVGRSGPDSIRVAEKIGELSLERDVIILGEVSDAKLIPLYKQALFLLYPSLFEGFGFPILEAWAANIPILTSNNSSMKEIAEGAAELVEPLDVNSISDGIISLLLDSDRKEKYTKYGRAKLETFSWETSAKKILNIYDSLR